MGETRASPSDNWALFGLGRSSATVWDPISKKGFGSPEAVSLKRPNRLQILHRHRNYNTFFPTTNSLLTSASAKVHNLWHRRTFGRSPTVQGRMSLLVNSSSTRHMLQTSVPLVILRYLTVCRSWHHPRNSLTMRVWTVSLCISLVNLLRLGLQP